MIRILGDPETADIWGQEGSTCICIPVYSLHVRFYNFYNLGIANEVLLMEQRDWAICVCVQHEGLHLLSSSGETELHYILYSVEHVHQHDPSACPSLKGFGSICVLIMLLKAIDYEHSAIVLVHTDPVNGVISPENDRPASLVPDLIDYNMPLTTTYLKQMKLQCINNKEQVHTILGSLFLTDNTFTR